MYIHNVPKVYSDYAPLINKIDQLVDFGYENSSTLPQFYKDEILTLIMEAMGDDQSYVIFDNEDFNMNCDYLKSFIKSSSLRDAYKFAKSLKASAFKNYESYIDLIMDELKSQRSAA